MSTLTLIDNIIANVRAILRREPHFADMPRYQLDLHLADFERDLHHDLDAWNAQTDRVIDDEIRWARDRWEEEQEAKAKATKPKISAKSRKNRRRSDHRQNDGQMTGGCDVQRQRRSEA